MSKLYKGGYQIVDLGGTDFTSGSASTVVGAHAALIGAGTKPTAIANYSIGGTVYPHAFVPFSVDEDGTYTGKFAYGDGTVAVTVTNADVVTITVAE